MKTKIFGLCPGKIILAAFLFTLFAPAAGAQNLTLIFPSDARRVLIPFGSSDSHGGSYGDTFVAITNVAGAFNISGTVSTPGNYDFCGAHCTASQDSTITATATNLSITGQVEISSAGTAVNIEGQPSGNGSGSASWAGLSEMFIGFTIDRYFTYSLQATTTMNTNSTETVPIAMVGLDHYGDAETSLPDIVAYGSAMQEGGGIFLTAPSASGTNTGVFTNGTYYFIARVHSASYVDPDHSPMSEHFLVTFNLTVTYVPQPPDRVAFTPNGTGAFNLVWNAPQPGNYRVLSSTNLIDWVEAIPAAAWPSSLNTNAVSAIPGLGQGFFRIEYLP
jgi:hypothetical protein